MSTLPVGRFPERSGAQRPERPTSSDQTEVEAATPSIPQQGSGNRRGTWGFQPSDDGWLKNLQAYQAFCGETGRRPRARGEDPAERRLARWISSQRQDFRALILPAARRIQLDESIPGWAD